MFQAGAVLLSSLFLLQLLTGPEDGTGPLSVSLDEVDPPVSAGLIALPEVDGLATGLNVDAAGLLRPVMPAPWLLP